MKTLITLLVLTIALAYCLFTARRSGAQNRNAGSRTLMINGSCLAQTGRRWGNHPDAG